MLFWDICCSSTLRGILVFLYGQLCEDPIHIYIIMKPTVEIRSSPQVWIRAVGIVLSMGDANAESELWLSLTTEAKLNNWIVDNLSSAENSHKFAEAWSNAQVQESREQLSGRPKVGWPSDLFESNLDVVLLNGVPLPT